MRAGVAAAIHHAEERAAFGKLLVDQPLMRNVLADLAVESEPATIASMRLARAYDESIAGDEQATAFKRIANAVLKYWLCKRAPAHAAEALECFGGNGFVEESGMPRLFRESPLNSIWEGSGNVQCLDVLRAMVGSPRRSTPSSPRSARPRARSRGSTQLPPGPRRTHRPRADRGAARAASSNGWRSSLQGSLAVRFADPAVADAFCASRLGGDWGHAFGTLPAGTDFERIIDRHAVSERA